jgi:hypothetical protein
MKNFFISDSPISIGRPEKQIELAKAWPSSTTDFCSSRGNSREKHPNNEETGRAVRTSFKSFASGAPSAGLSKQKLTSSPG